MTRSILGIKKIVLAVIVMVGLLVLASLAAAQTDTTPKKRLLSTGRAHGVIGGESHRSYVIRARKGQTMRVQLDWRKAEENQAEFTVTRSKNFFVATPVNFGRELGQGSRWVGRIPRSGDYYIYVVAHPSANYSLKVSLK